MFADSGAKAPPGVGTGTPQQVASAVVRAIERDKSEISVAPVRQRALARFAMLAPELSGRVAGGAATKARGRDRRRDRRTSAEDSTGRRDMSDTFGARDTLEVSGREYEIFRLDALQDSFDVARLPYSIKVLLENSLRLEDGESVTAREHRGDRELGCGRGAERRDPLPAGEGPHAGLHGRAGPRRSRRDAGRDGRAGRRSREDRPARPRGSRDRPLGSGRCVRQRRAPSTSTPTATTSETGSATRSCAGASRRSTTSAWCRRRPGSATR